MMDLTRRAKRDNAQENTSWGRPIYYMHHVWSENSLLLRYDGKVERKRRGPGETMVMRKIWQIQLGSLCLEAKQCIVSHSMHRASCWPRYTRFFWECYWPGNLSHTAYSSDMLECDHRVSSQNSVVLPHIEFSPCRSEFFFLSWVIKPQLNHWTEWVVKPQFINLNPKDFCFFLCFSWVANSQLNHWTKCVVNTQLITQDPRDCPGPLPTYL